jgi:protein-arginine kinase activator protein McsA
MTMQEDLIAQEVLKILMESGVFRDEEIALETLQNAPEEWLEHLTEEASFAAISSLQKSLENALKQKDFDRARAIREKIKQLSA